MKIYEFTQIFPNEYSCRMHLKAFREKEGNPSITEAVQTSLFRWIPAITYNFKFK